MKRNPASSPATGQESRDASRKRSAAIAGKQRRVRRAFTALITHRWFAACATLCAVAFAWVNTGGTGQLIARETFGDFYDHQAASMLHGRLDVPLKAISFEAFVLEGKYYSYFGLTPALLRIPFVLTGVAFGELSRLFMVAYFAAALVAAYLLLLHAVRLVRGGEVFPGAGTIVLFVVCAGLGNTLFFLSSRAYIYHEAILCGATFALWGVWCALRHLVAPAGRWWIGSLVCGLLSVHARPPTGLFSLATIGAVALTLAWRQWQEARNAARPLSRDALRRPALLAVFAATAVLSFNALSYVKFGTFEGCPLRLHVQYDDARLAKFEGRLFHLANLLPNAGVYLLRAGFAPRPYFPYLVATAPGMPPVPAKLDVVEPVAGIPFAMPALTALATLGAAAAFATARNTRPAIIVIWAGAVPMIASMFAAIALSQRYTADFCPLLIASGSFGAAAFDALLPRWRRLTGGAFGALVALNILIMLALTLHHQGEVVWGVSTAFRRNYAALRERVDTFFGRANPSGYSADRLAIASIDATTALYLPLQFAKMPAALPKALELCDDALREYRDHAYILFGVGEIYATAKDGLPKAIECFERGLKLNPDLPLAHQALADFLVAGGRAGDAIAHYQAALRLNPRWAPTHNNLAIAYLKLNRFNEALSAFDNAQRIDPIYSGNFERLKADLKTRP